MKRALLTLFLVALLSSLSTAQTYKLDPDHSFVGFEVRHMTINLVVGQFKKVEGTVKMNGADFTKAQIEAKIDVKSVDTGVAKRDGHLGTPDFFDSARFPNMTFKSTQIKALGNSKYVITGDLTIRGTTKEISLDADYHGPIKDPWGMTRIGLEMNGKINRQDFGMRWDQTLDGGGLIVGNEVRLVIKAEGIQ